MEPEPESELEWIPSSADVIGTYLLEGPGGDMGTFWSCSVTVSRAGGGKLDCDIVDHWSEPSGSRTVRKPKTIAHSFFRLVIGTLGLAAFGSLLTPRLLFQDTYECIAEICVGGIVLTDRTSGRRFHAGVIDGGLRVNSALFPIAVSASFGATSKYYVLKRIRDPRRLMQEQRQRAERAAGKRAKGRLRISSVKHRAEAKSRRELLEYCLPTEELAQDARSPPSTPLKMQNRTEPAVSPPDEPGGASATTTELEPCVTEPLGLADSSHTRPAGDRTIGAHRHIPWRERTRKSAVPPTNQRSKDWPRSGPLILKGDVAAAAEAKARAAARLNAGEFPQAVAELKTAKKLAGAKDQELPVLIAQAKAGVTAARGLSPSERSAWSRVYGPEEPAGLSSANDSVELQKFADDNGACGACRSGDYL